jgi:Holliday junction resolvase-like predicted endonuclease
MPLPEEEELILKYLNQGGHRITQKEYNKLLKEISSLLISAPKNAIAIELKKKDSNTHKKNLEICYHIKVKNTLSQANFKYFQYKGKTSSKG